jgi:L-alanine-DL-glutamate epimerase-like enolase superfamily enzyme
MGLATDLHLSSAFSDTDLVEYLTGSPYVDEIGTEKWVLDEDGMLPIPNRPGLGIELDPDALTKYSRGEAFL